MTDRRPHRADVAGGIGLAALVLLALLNSVGADDLPLWRQLVFPVLASLAYLHGRRLRARGAKWVLAGAAVLTAALLLVDFGTAATGAMLLALFVVAPWLAGRNRRQQAELARLVARSARAEERTRIATELHDLVGHDLALIAVRAGALEVSPGLAPADRAGDRAAVAGIRETAVEATDRLRAVLGALRDGADGGPLAPPDETIAALVTRAASAGLDVRLEGGPEAPSAGSLAEQAAHRVVQEALTNAARHAPGAAVTVRVLREDGTVQVEVANDGGAAQPVPASRGSGLLGLAERVRVVGGTFAAGPTGEGFAVRARIPAAGEES
ncbi:sensor histidine kinase [Promicromonospora sukumoe]|uniref:sensor histidine kinase n=1 Tax=Promicromonospora sukumoe TaxID=88382 RepID=UPI0003784BBB|nr:histidine kinase [Promicromonospora sukumoe]